MSENETQQCYTNRTWMYHSSGLKIEVGLPRGAAETLAEIQEYLDAGFTVYAPEGDGGLDRMNVVSCIRGQVTNGNVTTDRIYMYADFGLPQYQAQQVVYLNTPEDTAAFEAASHLKVADMPIVKGKASPNRESGDYERLAKECQFPILRKKVNVTVENPKGNWEFVRYAGATTAQKPPKTPLISTDDNDSTDLPQTAKDKAIAWAKSKGFDTNRYPYGNGDAHSEVIAKAWCEAIFKQQGKVEATG